MYQSSNTMRARPYHEMSHSSLLLSDYCDCHQISINYRCLSNFMHIHVSCLSAVVIAPISVLFVYCCTSTFNVRVRWLKFRSGGSAFLLCHFECRLRTQYKRQVVVAQGRGLLMPSVEQWLTDWTFKWIYNVYFSHQSLASSKTDLIRFSFKIQHKLMKILFVPKLFGRRQK